MKNLVYLRGSDAVIECWDYAVGLKRDCWIDAADLERISTLRGTWAAIAARKSTSKWYVIGKQWDAVLKRSQTVMFHRYLLGIVDPATEVHHKDNDGLNNRRSNLESVSHKRNMRERFPERNWTEFESKRTLRTERSKRNAAFRAVRKLTGYTRQTIWQVYNGRTKNVELLALLNKALAGEIAPLPTKHKRA